MLRPTPRHACADVPRQSARLRTMTFVMSYVRPSAVLASHQGVSSRTVWHIEPNASLSTRQLAAGKPPGSSELILAPAIATFSPAGAEGGLDFGFGSLPSTPTYWRLRESVSSSCRRTVEPLMLQGIHRKPGCPSASPRAHSTPSTVTTYFPKRCQQQSILLRTMTNSIWYDMPSQVSASHQGFLSPAEWHIELPTISTRSPKPSAQSTRQLPAA